MKKMGRGPSGATDSAESTGSDESTGGSDESTDEPGKREEGGSSEKSPFPDKPEGPIEPLTKDDVLELLDEVETFGSAVQDAFKDLKQKADEVSGDEEDLNEVGQHIQGLLEGLSNVAAPESDRLAQKWMRNMVKLVYAGVEDEGQCHKVLELLIKMQMEADKQAAGGKRQMSPEELAFWQKVAEAGKEEVGCIIHRFDEFLGLIRDVAGAIRNPPSDYNENGHAFEAEVLMGALYFGYGHLYRQVSIFAHVMHALLNHEQEAEQQQGQQKLRELLAQAQMVKREMESLKGFKKFFH